MNITVEHALSGRAVALDLPEDMDAGDVLALVAAELALEATAGDLVLLWHGTPLAAGRPLSAFGVTAGATLAATTTLELSEAFAAAALPYVAVQRRLAEHIQLENVEAARQTALEHMPEAFASVTMLYVDARINGHAVKAFVDSGAQMTILSSACAARCGVDRLIDARFAGTAVGVGSQRIVGRIHVAQLELAGAFLPCSFSVLEDQPMEMILGLDMLRRHQCVLDLNRNVLHVGTSGRDAPFLGEADVPLAARLEQRATPPGKPEPAPSSAAPAPTPAPAKTAPATPATPAPAPVTVAGGYPDAVVTALSQIGGFTRQQVLDALDACNGDADAAATRLVNSFLL